ncbi:MAG: sugar ABC transporter permease [Anaerolineales bacterium]
MSSHHLDRDRIIAILLITPSVLAVGVFVYAFIGWSGWASLIKWNDMLPLRSVAPLPDSWTIFPPYVSFAGLDNYIRLIVSDERFQKDIQNTLVFTVLFLVSCIGSGLLLAVLLDRKIRAEALFRNIFLSPYAVSLIVTGVVWRWVLSPGTAQGGATGVNLLLEQIGLGFLKNGWYTDPNIGIKAVVIAAVWQMAGYTMALYLAGLRSISEELREAARVDGANEWQIFRFIVLPLLQPVSISALVILGHQSLKIFDLISSMTGPGPGFSTDVPAYYMFDTVFRGNNFSRGAAIAIIMLILASIIVIPYIVNSVRQGMKT